MSKNRPRRTTKPNGKNPAKEKLTGISGFFDSTIRNIAFANVTNDDRYRHATELHEAVHTQLSHTTHLGAMTLHILRYSKDFSSNPKQKELMDKVLLALYEIQMPVQEAVATTCQVLLLRQLDTELDLAIMETIPDAYRAYMRPFEPFLGEHFSCDEDPIAGAINVGLMAMNSPIFEEFSRVSVPRASSYVAILKKKEFQPLTRLTRILSEMQNLNLMLGAMDPQQTIPRFRKVLREVGVPIPEGDILALNQRSIDELLGSPLFQMDPEAADRYRSALTPDERIHQIEDFAHDGEVFFPRDFQCQETEARDFESRVIDFCEITRREDVSSVLEVRSEDVFMFPDTGEVLELEAAQVRVNFFPVAGISKRDCFSILDKHHANRILREANKRGAHILVSSQRYSFKRGTFVGLTVPKPYCIVLSLGSVSIVKRLVSIYPRNPQLRFTILEYSSVIFVVLADVFKQKMVLMPASTFLLDEIVDVFQHASISHCSPEYLEAWNLSTRVEIAMYHLTALGWASENQLREIRRIIVPTDADLQKWDS